MTISEVHFQYKINASNQAKGRKKARVGNLAKASVNGRIQHYYTPQQLSGMLFALGYLVHKVEGKKYLCTIRREIT